MTPQTIGEVAAILGVIGSLVYVVLWRKNTKAVRELTEKLLKHPH